MGQLAPLAPHDVYRKGNFYFPKSPIPKWLDYFVLYGLSHPSQHTIDHISATYGWEMKQELRFLFDNLLTRKRIKEGVYYGLKLYVQRVEQLAERVAHDPKITDYCQNEIAASIRYGLYPPYALPNKRRIPEVQPHYLAVYQLFLPYMDIVQARRSKRKQATPRSLNPPTAKQAIVVGPAESSPQTVCHWDELSTEMLTEIISHLGSWITVMFQLNTGLTSIMEAIQQENAHMVWPINRFRPLHTFRTFFFKNVHRLNELHKTMCERGGQMHLATMIADCGTGPTVQGQMDPAVKLVNLKKAYQTQRRFMETVMQSLCFFRMLQLLGDLKLATRFFELHELKEAVVNILMSPNNPHLVLRLLTYAVFASGNQTTVFCCRRVLQWHAEAIGWLAPQAIQNTRRWADYTDTLRRTNAI